jgi:hypothetical protein
LSLQIYRTAANKIAAAVKAAYPNAEVKQVSISACLAIGDKL